MVNCGRTRDVGVECGTATELENIIFTRSLPEITDAAEKHSAFTKKRMGVI